MPFLSPANKLKTVRLNNDIFWSRRHYLDYISIMGERETVCLIQMSGKCRENYSSNSRKTFETNNW